MSKLKIAVIIGSVRPTRQGDKPARWIADLAKQAGHFDVEIVDLMDYPLPLFDAPASDFWMPTPNETAGKWQAKLSGFDGYIFVTPEYNHSMPASLKNAIDWAYKPFMRKPVAYVSYGGSGGVRAVEHLRGVMVELQSVSVRHAVHIGAPDFTAIMFGKKTWDEVLPAYVATTKDLFESLRWWAAATKAAREADKAAAA